MYYTIISILFIVFMLTSIGAVLLIVKDEIVNLLSKRKKKVKKNDIKRVQ